MEATFFLYLLTPKKKGGWGVGGGTKRKYKAASPESVPVHLTFLCLCILQLFCLILKAPIMTSQ